MTGGGAIVHQATAVAIGGRAVLIEGPAGSGKSGLALALIDRGAMLIGDDGIVLTAAPDGTRLTGSPHPRTRGLIEVRNLGLLTMPVIDHAPIALVVLLDAAAPRHIERAETTLRGGVPLPQVRLTPHEGVGPLKLELALQRFGLPAN